MSKVKRYALSKETCDFEETKYGCFVWINDYEKLESENEELKRDLRQQIELNALAEIGFKMYVRNVESGGLHKDRKDAIERYEKEVSNLKAQVEQLTRAANWLLLQWDANHNGGETSRVGSNSINELRNAVKDGKDAQ